MRNLHIIMPMAGEGTRFSKEGYGTPKPLLRIDDTYFFDKALHSLWNLYNYIYQSCTIKFTFIVRQEHIDKYHIDEIIKNKYFNAKIISVEHTTRGAVETCLLAEKYIEHDDALLIMDCDLWFNAHIYEEYILTALTNGMHNLHGVLLSFTSTDSKYSYAKTTTDDWVIETAEKNPISNHALIGSYFFTYATDFLSAAHKLIQDNDVKDIKEYYVSLLYNYLINNGYGIKCIPVYKYTSFGTPEELQEYENRSNNN